MKTAYIITITREKRSTRAVNRPARVHRAVHMHAKTVRLHACGAGALGAMTSTDGHDHSITVHMQPQYAQFETYAVQIETYAAQIHTHTVQIETQNAQLHGKGPRYSRFRKSQKKDTVTFTRRKSNNHVKAATNRCTISCVWAGFSGVVLCPRNRKR